MNRGWLPEEEYAARGLLQELDAGSTWVEEYVGWPSPFVLPSASLDAAFHVTQVRRHPLCQHASIYCIVSF